jgi:hypothetical protein
MHRHSVADKGNNMTIIKLEGAGCAHRLNHDPFNSAAVIDAQGREIPITEEMVHRALQALEQDPLMTTMTAMLKQIRPRPRLVPC